MADLKDAIDNAPDDDNEDDEDIAKAKYTPPDGGPAPTDDSKAVMDRLLSGGQPQNSGAIDTSKWPKHQPAATPQGQLSDTENNAIGKVFGTTPGQPTTSPPQANGPVGPPATAKDDGHLTPNAGTPEAEAFRQKLMGIESHGGRYDDVNPVTNAGGAYQFVPSVWDKWMEKNFGHDVESMVVRKGDDPATVAAKKQQQDQAFNKYYETELVPWVNKVKKSGDSAGYNDYQLGYLYHREGPDGAQEFLQTGKAPGDSEPGNGPIKDALAKMGATPDPNAPRGDGSKPTGAKMSLASGHPELPNIQDVSSGAKHDVASLQTIMDHMNGPQSQDQFAAQLQSLRDDLKEQKSKIAQRELIDTIADALTKIGAGAYGAKTHVDMSHFETKPHDYQKDQEIAQGEFRANLDDLKSQREDDLHRRSAAAEVGYHQQELGLKQDEIAQSALQHTQSLQLEAYKAATENDRAKQQAIYQQGEDEYRKAMLNFQNHREDQEYKRKLDEAWQNKVAAFSAKAVATMNSKEYEKDPDNGAAGLAAQMANELHVDPKIAHAAFFKPGILWGENVRKPAEMSMRMSEALTAHLPSPTEEGSLVTVINSKTGQVGHIPRASLGELQKQGNGEWQPQKT